MDLCFLRWRRMPLLSAETQSHFLLPIFEKWRERFVAGWVLVIGDLYACGEDDGMLR